MPFQFEGLIIVIKKNETVPFCKPTAPLKRMDKSLLEHWMSNPKSLPGWNKALLAYKHCLESLPVGTDASIMADMLLAKKKFQRAAQEMRTPV
jgi:hypothetical protein